MKLKSMLWAALCLLYLPTLAQVSEPEPVERYRKVETFTMPDPGKASESTYVQPPVEIGNSTPGVNYSMEPGVRKLLDVHKRRNAAAEEADGFRIQIYAGSDQNIANQARADFLANFSRGEMDIHQTWDPPHFRVRVGDFRNRAEGMRELPNVRRIFPDAFVVSDKIKLRKTKRTVAPAPGTVIPPGSGTEEDAPRGAPDQR